ncbi:Transposase DDE domain protein [Meiothermus luteus]|jgi:hypothetical protein|uniref:Transposase DDE domain protein n=1 Tax=Meiothermus luteus TaxID=2026184 RepID=A0A399ERM5_9DEIN|nr:Transposase DDE domain protein [Meiothermus luteus]
MPGLPTPPSAWQGKRLKKYGVATFPATPRTLLVWGRRRFTIEHFFRAMKSEFSLGQFGQRTPLGVHRFLVLSFLAYLLAHWVKLTPGEGCTWWEAGREGSFLSWWPGSSCGSSRFWGSGLRLWGQGWEIRVYAGYTRGASFEIIYIDLV